MEKIIFVFLDIWSTNICYIHNLCDLGWVRKKAKPTFTAWIVPGESPDVYPVYTGSGMYHLCNNSKKFHFLC